MKTELVCDFILTSAALWACCLMSCHRAAGYTTIPPEFHMDVFARLLVRPGASRAAAASQGLPYTNSQAHHEAHGSTARGRGTELPLCMGTGVGAHESTCRCVNAHVQFHAFAIFLCPCSRFTSSESTKAISTGFWVQREIGKGCRLNMKCDQSCQLSRLKQEIHDFMLDLSSLPLTLLLSLLKRSHALRKGSWQKVAITHEPNRLRCF